MPQAVENLFSDSAITLLKQNCPSFSELEVDKKQYVYHQGEQQASIFWVAEGFVRQASVSEAGDEMTTAFLRKGGVFGVFQSEDSVVTEESIQAWPNVRVCFVRTDEMRDLFLDYPKMAWQLIQRISAQKQHTERRLQSIFSQKVDVRVLETLCELVHFSSKRCNHGFSLELMMTQQDLADFVGASRPVVSTILNKLKKQGLLAYVEDRICVYDEALFAYRISQN